MAVYKDEAKGTWYCQFRYKDWTGKTKSTTKRGFKTKREAKQYEVDAIRKSTQNPKMTLQELVDKYLEHYKLHRKTSSYISVLSRAEKHILPYLGDVYITDITSNTIREWQNVICSNGMSKTSIHIINSLFNTIMNFAVKFFALEKNPFSVAGSIGKLEKRTDFIEFSDFQKLIDVIDDEYMSISVKVLFYSGMRIGEFFALTEADIDFAQNTISITKTFSEYKNMVSTTKTTFSNRVITMPASIMLDIKHFFERLGTFPSMSFRLMTRMTFQKKLNTYTTKAGIKHICIHTLRHSHASYLIQQGVHITAISKRLGHSSPDITLKIYSHVYKDDDTQIASLLEKVLQKIK